MTPHLHSPLPPALEAATAARVAATFSLLADPSRLRILHALIYGGPMCVSDIAASTGVRESATSHQLSKLRGAGVVRSDRHGREIWYQVADAHIRFLLDAASEHYLNENVADA